MIRNLIIVVLAGAAVSAGAFGAPPAKGFTGPKAPPYSSVSGLIKSQCVSCHNATRHPEKVDVSSYAALMKSGEHGSIVVPGHPEKSALILYVDGTKQPRMPMKMAPLTATQIASLKAWVKAGAKP